MLSHAASLMVAVPGKNLDVLEHADPRLASVIIRDPGRRGREGEAGRPRSTVISPERRDAGGHINSKMLL